MLPAITVDGIIYSHIKEGSYNGDQFLEWLDGLLRVMNPYPARHSVLILDNCRIHHVEGVEERCEERWVISSLLINDNGLPELGFFLLVGLDSFTSRHILRISILLRSVFPSSRPIFGGMEMYFVILLKEVTQLSHFYTFIML